MFLYLQRMYVEGNVFYESTLQHDIFGCLSSSLYYSGHWAPVRPRVRELVVFVCGCFFSDSLSTDVVK